jgi:hypothetical protein
MADTPEVEGHAAAPGKEGGGGAVTDALRSRVAVAVAVIALLALAAMIWALWGKADDSNNETAWARWTFLLAGVEAIAFAGAGFLFGREVNRAAVQTAQSQAAEANESARQQAERAGGAEAAGRTVRNAIEAKTRAVTGGAKTDLLGGEAATGVSAELRELSELARATFPD